MDPPAIFSPLQSAVFRGDTDLFKRLIKQNCMKADRIDDTGRTLFHYIGLGTRNLPRRVDLSSFIKIANVLLCHDTIDAVDADGNTAMHLAVGGCSPSFMYWLIAKGALIMHNFDGESPLTLAEKSIQTSDAKTDSAKLKRADGVLVVAAIEGLFSFRTPPRFHCPQRFSLRTALVMGSLAKLIYKGEGCDSTEFPLHGNVIVHAFIKRWGFTSCHIVENKDARGMIVRYEAKKEQKFTVVAFRGTKTTKDIIADLRALKGTGGAHSGFYCHLNKIYDQMLGILAKYLTRTEPIYITGHSLGGAMATLMTKRLHEEHKVVADRLYMYTFGQPRAGTKDFQMQFDEAFKYAYIIQRHLDPVPMVPTFSGHVVGGYVHSGSLRFLDSSGQLYNDVHYQYEDIKRGMMEKYPKTEELTSMNELRKMWTEGLQQLTQVSVQENNSEFDFLGEDYDTTTGECVASASVPMKSPQQKGNNVVMNMIKGRADAVTSHGMLNYLDDIARLESRVNQPYSWEKPMQAISSQLASVTLPPDVFIENIKGFRYKEEQEQAYHSWVSDYTHLPGFCFALDQSVSCSSIVPWMKNESRILQQISEIEQAIMDQHPSLDKNICLPKTLHRREVSPLIEIGIYSIIYLVSQITHKEESLSMSYYRWLYWAMPTEGYFLKLFLKGTVPSYVLQNDSSSPYRRALQNCMLHMAREHTCDSLERIANRLPDIVREENGSKISNLSTTIYSLRSEWLREKQAAHLQLGNLEYALISEILEKFRALANKVIATGAAGVAIGAVTGAVAGTVAGVATGVAVTAVTAGVAAPIGVVAGVAVATTVGIGTTGAICGAVALHQIPKYLESIKNTLNSFEYHLDGMTSPDQAIKNSHKAEILKIAGQNPTRGRIMLYLFNGLYITLAMSKFKKVAINPHRKWVKGVGKQNTADQLKVFLRRALALINQVAIINIDEAHISTYLTVLQRILVSLDTRVEMYFSLFSDLGKVLSLPMATVGIDIFKTQMRLDENVRRMSDLLGNQLRPVISKASVEVPKQRNSTWSLQTPSHIVRTKSDLSTAERRTNKGWQASVTPYYSSESQPNISPHRQLSRQKKKTTEREEQ